MDLGSSAELSGCGNKLGLPLTRGTSPSETSVMKVLLPSIREADASSGCKLLVTRSC